MNFNEINETASRHFHFLIDDHGYQESIDMGSRFVVYRSPKMEIRIALHAPTNELKTIFRAKSLESELEMKELVELRIGHVREYDVFTLATSMDLCRHHYKKNEGECYEQYFDVCAREMKEHREFYAELLLGNSSAWIGLLKQKVEVEIDGRRYELGDLLTKLEFVKLHEPEFSIEEMIEEYWITY